VGVKCQTPRTGSVTDAADGPAAVILRYGRAGSPAARLSARPPPRVLTNVPPVAAMKRWLVGDGDDSIFPCDLIYWWYRPREGVRVPNPLLAGAVLGNQAVHRYYALRARVGGASRPPP